MACATSCARRHRFVLLHAVWCCLIRVVSCRCPNAGPWTNDAVVDDHVGLGVYHVSWASVSWCVGWYVFEWTPLFFFFCRRCFVNPPAFQNERMLIACCLSINLDIIACAVLAILLGPIRWFMGRQLEPHTYLIANVCELLRIASPREGSGRLRLHTSV